MKYYPANSLAFFAAVPQMKSVDHSCAPLSKIIPQVNAYWGRYTGAMPEKLASPDNDALEFYALNHLNAILRGKFHSMDTLPDWAVPVAYAYQKAVVGQSRRMFNYLLMIVTREARHLGGGVSPAFKTKVAEVSGVSGGGIAHFVCNKLPNLNETNAVKALLDPSTCPMGTLGEYLRALTYVFNKASWSSGYGGKAWGKVSQCLLNMVEGSMSMEVLTDSAFSLAHNNGPVFNKGMLYASYSSNFVTILDVQRSGQIPEYMLSHTTLPKVRAMVELVREKFPESFGGYVDWYLVEARGAVNKYTAQKQSQVSTHGLPDAGKHKAAANVAMPNPCAEVELTVKKPTTVPTSGIKFFVDPKAWVTQFQRKAS